MRPRRSSAIAVLGEGGGEWGCAMRGSSPSKSLPMWAVSIGVVAAAAAASASTAKPPNFLLLFPDQWRHDWTPENPALAGVLRMPTYMALKANGTRFSQPFVPSPLCAPSRACLASGKEYDEAGVPDNFSNDYPINQTTWMTLLAQVWGAGVAAADGGDYEMCAHEQARACLRACLFTPPSK
jgi:hypothetical protein